MRGPRIKKGVSRGVFQISIVFYFSVFLPFNKAWFSMDREDRTEDRSNQAAGKHLFTRVYRCRLSDY